MTPPLYELFSLPTPDADEADPEVSRDFSTILSSLNRSIRDGVRWLDEQYISTHGAWPSYQAADPDVWGGTCLVLYALHGSEQYDDRGRIENAVEWLKRSQLSDGSWWLYKSQNTGSVRATAWALIVLKLFQADYSTATFSDAVNWLGDACYSFPEGCAWGSTGRNPEDPHVHATILAVWALNAVDDELAEKGADLLLTKLEENGGLPKQDPRSDERNEAMTALGLFVLSQTGYLDPGEKLFENGVEWLLDQQDPDTGSWRRYDENWVYKADEHVRTMDATVEHPTTIWCLLALLESDLAVSDDRILQTVDAIIVQQDPESGIFDTRGQEHQPIYHTAYCLIALTEFYDEISSPAGVYELVEKHNAIRTDRIESQIEKFHKQFRLSLGIAYGLLILLTAQVMGLLNLFVTNLAEVFNWFASTILQQQSALLVGVVASLVGTVLIVVFRRFVLNKLESVSDWMTGGD